MRPISCPATGAGSLRCSSSRPNERVGSLRTTSIKTTGQSLVILQLGCPEDLLSFFSEHIHCVFRFKNAGFVSVLCDAHSHKQLTQLNKDATVQLLISQFNCPRVLNLLTHTLHYHCHFSSQLSSSFKIILLLAKPHHHHDSRSRVVILARQFNAQHSEYISYSCYGIV